MSTQATAMEIPSVLIERLLGAGWPDEQIVEYLQHSCRMTAEDAAKWVVAVRNGLAAQARKSETEHEAESRLIYARIKRDERANASQIMRAQQQLDQLLGLAERFAAMHAGGPDDSDVIEALACYRSLLYDPRANVAQRLRAQGALDKLRRLVPKKNTAAASAARPEPALARPPSVAKKTSPSAAPEPGPEKPGKSSSDQTALPGKPAVPARAAQSPPRPLPGLKKPGRNAPCPCGSGKKYKSCCRLAELSSGIPA